MFEWNLKDIDKNKLDYYILKTRFSRLYLRKKFLDEAFDNNKKSKTWRVSTLKSNFCMKNFVVFSTIEWVRNSFTLITLSNEVVFITEGSSHRRCSARKGVLRTFANFVGNTFARASFLIKLPAFFTEHLKGTASLQSTDSPLSSIHNNVWSNVENKTPFQEVVNAHLQSRCFKQVF